MRFDYKFNIRSPWPQHLASLAPNFLRSQNTDICWTSKQRRDFERRIYSPFAGCKTVCVVSKSPSIIEYRCVRVLQQCHLLVPEWIKGWNGTNSTTYYEIKPILLNLSLQFFFLGSILVFFFTQTGINKEISIASIYFYLFFSFEINRSKQSFKIME